MNLSSPALSGGPWFLTGLIFLQQDNDENKPLSAFEGFQAPQQRRLDTSSPSHSFPLGFACHGAQNLQTLFSYEGTRLREQSPDAWRPTPSW